jgi:hypothetical protein
MRQKKAVGLIIYLILNRFSGLCSCEFGEAIWLVLEDRPFVLSYRVSRNRATREEQKRKSTFAKASVDAVAPTGIEPVSKV